MMIKRTSSTRKQVVRRCMTHILWWPSAISLDSYHPTMCAKVSNQKSWTVVTPFRRVKIHYKTFHRVVNGTHSFQSRRLKVASACPVYDHMMMTQLYSHHVTKLTSSISLVRRLNKWVMMYKCTSMCASSQHLRSMLIKPHDWKRDCRCSEYRTHRYPVVMSDNRRLPVWIRLVSIDHKVRLLSITRPWYNKWVVRWRT